MFLSACSGEEAHSEPTAETTVTTANAPVEAEKTTAEKTSGTTAEKTAEVSEAAAEETTVTTENAPAEAEETTAEKTSGTAAEKTTEVSEAAIKETAVTTAAGATVEKTKGQGNSAGGGRGGSSVTVPDEEEHEGNLVWVPTNGGTKYHCNAACSKMKDPMQVTKETAIANGYTACKRCYR